MLEQINVEKLFAIAMRVVSYDSVDDVRAFAQAVQQAAALVIKAAYRIAGIGPQDGVDDTRALDPDAETVDRIVEEYED